jgi:DNA (cytosine-5)-methyltransferase 1
MAFTTEQTPKFNEEQALTLTKQSPTGGGQVQSVAYTTKLHNTQSNQAGKFYEEYATSLDRSSPPPAVIASTVGTLSCNTGPNGHDAGNFACNQAVDAGHVLPHAMQVRRLTPRECERLQGFPEDYTLIPWRKKPADQCPDSPRYKALGNSWAVPVVRWIGYRIQAETLKGLA